MGRRERPWRSPQGSEAKKRSSPRRLSPSPSSGSPLLAVERVREREFFLVSVLGFKWWVCEGFICLFLWVLICLEMSLNMVYPLYRICANDMILSGEKLMSYNCFIGLRLYHGDGSLS